MLANRLRQRALSLSVAAFAVLAVFAIAAPAMADDVTAAARAPQAKRSTTSFSSSLPTTLGSPTQSRGGSAGGFLYFPGAQPGMNIGGRLNVAKHVYVPYYGNVSNDPAHPGVQGTAGIAYGFRTWDISVLNGGFGTVQPALPGSTNEAPKLNPALTFSIRF